MGGSKLKNATDSDAVILRYTLKSQSVESFFQFFCVFSIHVGDCWNQFLENQKTDFPGNLRPDFRLAPVVGIARRRNIWIPLRELLNIDYSYAQIGFRVNEKIQLKVGPWKTKPRIRDEYLGECLSHIENEGAKFTPYICQEDHALLNDQSIERTRDHTRARGSWEWSGSGSGSGSRAVGPLGCWAIGLC